MPEPRTLGSTGLRVHPVGLGTNSFGWGADEPAAFAVLDAYAQAGGNHIDTAHTYPGWAPGCEGGESEAIIGRWLTARPGMRERVVIATKVGMAGGRFEKGLRREQIERWVEGCLGRLGVEHIDLLYAHEDDPDTPLEETLGALNDLVAAGTVGHLGASNIGVPRLTEALRVGERNGWARYEVLQPAYNLVRRDGYEGSLDRVCTLEGLAVVPYPALAGGFLTGKYRPGLPPPAGVRAQGGQALADTPRGGRVLEELDRLAEAHGATPAQVAVAWLLSRPNIASALASATRAEQVTELMPAADLRLDDREVAALAAAADGT